MSKHFLYVPVFAGVSEEALMAIENEAIGVCFQKGEVVVKEGESGNSMFIITSGSVDIIKHLGSEQETTLATLKSGDFFGEMCLVETLPRAASVRTIEMTELYELKIATLHHIFQFWPEQFCVVILNIARDLSRRLRAIDEAYSSRTG